MTQHEIVALRCPSCGGGITEPSREMPFGAEFRCDNCGITSVLIIDRALVPLSTLLKQGEKVCTTCGRMELREARFCQEGHALVRKCQWCLEDVAVDHQRCDFCGNLKDALQLHEVYQGTVCHISNYGAFVEILPGLGGVLDISEIANHPVKDGHDELKEGEKISVKIIKFDGRIIKLGRP